jgi:hypothetical protein
MLDALEDVARFTEEQQILDLLAKLEKMRSNPYARPDEEVYHRVKTGLENRLAQLRASKRGKEHLWS